ncbi:MAG: hypothetical protein PUF31_07590 [Oscillospiraceae bacterium]|nr:hypothetical protein [Oscillospiraceae bacterium]
MCMKLREYQNDIKQYCDRNNLSFDKIMTSIKGCGNDSIIFQIAGDKPNKQGLLDETPLPTVLIMRKRKNGTGVEFEQTEYTQKYLAQ